jgi:AcrR family transcriptional regulator
LFAAMVAVVARRGYRAATVADVLELSGVSRSAFYRHFANKQDCFLAACDAVVSDGMETVSAAYRTKGPWDRRLQAAFEAFVDVIVSQPAAARMTVVEIYAAGPAATERSDRAAAAFERLVRQSLDQSPTRAHMPAPIVRGIVGGIRKVIHTRLRRGEEGQLPSLVPALSEWATSYRTPPTSIRRPRARPALDGNPRFVVSSPVERIYAAVATSVALTGYSRLTVADIIANASTSLTTFYTHFRNKEEAFLAAYDAGGAQSFAAALPAYQRAPDWPHAVRAGLAALLAYLAAEPAWAQLSIVEVLAAGPLAMERRDSALSLFEGLLGPGYELAPDVHPVVAEAIGGAIYALMYEQIRDRGAHRLPELLPAAVIIALAPFVGTEAACKIANEREATSRV